MRSKSHTLARVVAALVPVTYALLVFGSTVRAHGAGLACPDWPLCFGEVVPQLDFQIFLEWGHRALAGMVSLAWLGVGVTLVRDAELWARLRAVYLLGTVLLGVQVVLGGLTVLHLLAEWTVASHLIGGNSFAATMLLLALSLRELVQPKSRPAVGWGTRALAGGFAVAFIGQLALGGLVSSSGAGLACGTWPGCNGSAWFPTFEGLIGLQVTHRVVAYTLGALALANAALSGVRRPALVLLGLVGAQITLGVANVFLHIPVEVTVAHSAGADAIALCTLWLNWEAWRAPLASAETQRGLAPAEAR